MRPEARVQRATAPQGAESLRRKRQDVNKTRESSKNINSKFPFCVCTSFSSANGRSVAAAMTRTRSLFWQSKIDNRFPVVEIRLTLILHQHHGTPQTVYPHPPPSQSSNAKSYVRVSRSCTVQYSYSLDVLKSTSQIFTRDLFGK